MEELAKNQIGCVFMCQHKVVHINLKGLSLHFTEEAFSEFNSMIRDAFSKLMDINLSKLIGDYEIDGNG